MEKETENEFKEVYKRILQQERTTAKFFELVKELMGKVIP